MARIPNRLLEHRVILREIETIPSSTGPKYKTPRTVRAIVVDETKIVKDQREQSRGAEILSSAHVLVQPENRIPPGSLVTIWPGTDEERESEIVRTALGKHSIAPSSAQFWLE